MDCVPAETAFRIWDTFLYEGDKVVFRYALGMLKTHEAEILKITDKMKMFIYMRGMTAELWDAETLQKNAFSIDGWSGFKGKDVLEKRLRYLDDVKVETQKREARYGVCVAKRAMLLTLVIRDIMMKMINQLNNCCFRKKIRSQLRCRRQPGSLTKITSPSSRCDLEYMHFKHKNNEHLTIV